MVVGKGAESQRILAESQRILVALAARSVSTSRARGKLRGFRPEAAVRHSVYLCA